MPAVSASRPASPQRVPTPLPDVFLALIGDVDLDSHVTKAHAARLINCSTPYVHHLMEKGRWRYLRYGRTWDFPTVPGSYIRSDLNCDERYTIPSYTTFRYLLEFLHRRVKPLPASGETPSERRKREQDAARHYRRICDLGGP